MKAGLSNTLVFQAFRYQVEEGSKVKGERTGTVMYGREMGQKEQNSGQMEAKGSPSVLELQEL